MPTQWTLDLDGQVTIDNQTTFGHLHGLACQFFEQPDTVHAAPEKPFAVRLSTTDAKPEPTTSIVLTWLPDPPPTLAPAPQVVRIGQQLRTVHTARRRTIHYEQLESAPTSRRATLTLLTPTLFRHNNRDYPLPDPYITFASLARQYLRYRPAHATDTDLRALASTVVVYTAHIRTQPFLWHGHTSAGFVGQVEFGLPKTAPQPLPNLFTTLCRFADLAGIGHGTTHGLGTAHLHRPHSGAAHPPTDGGGARPHQPTPATPRPHQVLTQQRRLTPSQPTT